MAKADTEYRRLLSLNPNSVKALRSYARFLLEVANDKGSVAIRFLLLHPSLMSEYNFFLRVAGRAASMLTQADEIEDERSHEAKRSTGSADIFSRVSHDSTTLTV